MCVRVVRVWAAEWASQDKISINKLYFERKLFNFRKRNETSQLICGYFLYVSFRCVALNLSFRLVMFILFFFLSFLSRCCCLLLSLLLLPFFLSFFGRYCFSVLHHFVPTRLFVCMNEGSSIDRKRCFFGGREKLISFSLTLHSLFSFLFRLVPSFFSLSSIVDRMRRGNP